MSGLEAIRKATEREKADALLGVADRLAPQIGAAFSGAVAHMRAAADTKAAAEAIRAGWVERAVDAALPAAVLNNAWEGVTNAVQSAVTTSANAAAALNGPVNGLVVRFNVTSPGVQAWLSKWELMALQGFTAETRAAVTDLIRTGVLAGRNPLDIARSIPRSIGLTARMERAAQNYEAALREGRMGDAAAYRLRDRRYGHAGQPGEDRIRVLVDRYREKALKLRQETIARTETIRALGAGQHLLWEQQIEAGKVKRDRVRRKWIYTAGGKVRHSHRTIPSMNPKGVAQNEPFKSLLGPILFPGDPNATAANTINCMCCVIVRIIPDLEDKQPKPPPPPPKAPPKPKAPTLMDAIDAKPTIKEQEMHVFAEWDPDDKDLAKVIAKTKPLSDVRKDDSQGAYYMPHQHYISMKSPGQWGGLPKTARHEYGHAIDFAGQGTVARSVTPASGDGFLAAEKAWAKPKADDGWGDRLFRKLDAAAGSRMREEIFREAADEVGLKGVTLADYAVLRARSSLSPELRREAAELLSAIRRRDLAQFVRSAEAFLPDGSGGRQGDGETSSPVELWARTISRGKHGWGHSEDYYNNTQSDRDFNGKVVRNGMRIVEMWATYFETKTGKQRQETVLALLKVLAPKVVMEFDRIVKEIAK